LPRRNPGCPLWMRSPSASSRRPRARRAGGSCGPRGSGRRRRRRGHRGRAPLGRRRPRGRARRGGRSASDGALAGIGRGEVPGRARLRSGPRAGRAPGVEARG
jgi:hypothetical protein